MDIALTGSELIDASNATSTPKPNKRDIKDVEMSPVGTFSLSDLSRLLDKKLKPINDQLVQLHRIPALEESVKKLQSENKSLQERLLKCEIHLKKNNIKIFGLKEEQNENIDNKVISIFKEFCTDFNDRTFTSIYRLGQKHEGAIRPILATFFHPKDKYLLQKQTSKINSKHELKIVDDYPQPIETARKHLLPIFYAAKKLNARDNNVPKPKLRDDKLIIEGKSYNTTNLSSLPDNLKPEYIFSPSNNGITAFFTKHSPLSNHFISDSTGTQFNVNGQEYNCMEQFFMCTKALEFGDVEAYAEILKEKDPIKMKKIGRSISNYDHKHWLRVCENKIEVGLKEKFTQNEHCRHFLLATGRDIIAEASLDKLYGIGKSLSSVDLFDKRAWKGKNLMGKMLMRVRESLK